VWPFAKRLEWQIRLTASNFAPTVESNVAPLTIGLATAYHLGCSWEWLQSSGYNKLGIVALADLCAVSVLGWHINYALAEIVYLLSKEINENLLNNKSYCDCDCDGH